MILPAWPGTKINIQYVHFSKVNGYLWWQLVDTMGIWRHEAGHAHTHTYTHLNWATKAYSPQIQSENLLKVYNGMFLYSTRGCVVHPPVHQHYCTDGMLMYMYLYHECTVCNTFSDVYWLYTALEFEKFSLCYVTNISCYSNGAFMLKLLSTS